MKPDHEKAREWADDWSRRKLMLSQGITEGGQNLAFAYLDAMARLKKATELLRRADGEITRECGELACSDEIRAFLERKTQ